MDEDLTQIIQQIRSGGVSLESANTLIQRLLDKMTEEERDVFYRDSLFLMPTWKPDHQNQPPTFHNGASFSLVAQLGLDTLILDRKAQSNYLLA
jgi:hypothetical protein